VEVVVIEIQYGISDTDINPLLSSARRESEISQEAPLGIAGIRLSGGFDNQPVSEAVNVPGSAYNGAAIADAVTPLYQSGSITTTGSITRTPPTQVVLQQGGSAVVNVVPVIATSGDQSNKMAMALIDQPGTLSATQESSTMVTRDTSVRILDGALSGVAAELSTLIVNEAVAGSDRIDVEVFGNSGRVAGGTTTVLATLASGGTTYNTLSSAAVQPQSWACASAAVNIDIIASEILNYNTRNGLSSSVFIKGATIAPVVKDMVDQPPMEHGLTISGTIASLPIVYLD
jgi:hypothetical protein